jgi:AcrR family transcriptional regulator
MNNIHRGGDRMQPKVENARKKLMTHGKKILIKNGYSGIVIAKLAAECGMAAGTFYNYFKSKDALVNQIISDDWSAQLRKIEKQMEKPEDRYENLRCLYECLAAFQRRYRFLATCPAVKSEKIIRSEQIDLQRLYDIMTEKIRLESERSMLNFGTTPENAAYMIVQCCMVAGRRPDMKFDDLWNFLHVSNPAFSPIRKDIG